MGQKRTSILNPVNFLQNLFCKDFRRLICMKIAKRLVRNFRRRCVRKYKMAGKAAFLAKSAIGPLFRETRTALLRRVFVGPWTPRFFGIEFADKRTCALYGKKVRSDN